MGMESEIVAELGLIFLGVLGVGVATAAETALTIGRLLQSRQGREDGLSSSPADHISADDIGRFLTALTFLRTLSLAAIAGSVALWGWRQRPDFLTVIGALAVILWALLMLQALVRGIATRLPEQFIDRLLGALRVWTYALFPVVWPVSWLERKTCGEAYHLRYSHLLASEEGLQRLLSVSEEQGIIEQEEKEMIASIFEFSDTIVREVMVPRIDIVAVDVETSLREAAATMLEAGHSRVPVYRGNIDMIVGLLYAKDLLRCFVEGETERPLSEILRPAYFVPETKNVDELLQELQQRKIHLAIVVDEYGGTAGMVTIEDLLEEIVGEIQDEYDSEEPTVEKVSEDEFVFNARVDLDEVNKQLAVELPDAGGDTLGGLIYSYLGKVPTVGDKIVLDDVTFEVLSVDGQRIERVRARRTPAVADPPAGADSALSSLRSFLLTL